MTGVLAEQLARELGAGGDPTLVRTSGDPEAAGLVRVVAGAATAEDERVFRVRDPCGCPDRRRPDGRAVRPHSRTSSRRTSSRCKPGSGFPVDEIADGLAARSGAGRGRARRLAAGAARRRQSRRTEDGAVAAGALAVAGGGTQRLPVLALAQARMLSDVACGSGVEEAPRAVAEAVALPLAAALGTGLAARKLVRRVPFRSRLLESAVAAAVTYALATAFRRFPRR